MGDAPDAPDTSPAGPERQDGKPVPPPALGRLPRGMPAPPAGLPKIPPGFPGHPPKPPAGLPKIPPGFPMRAQDMPHTPNGDAMPAPGMPMPPKRGGRPPRGARLPKAERASFRVLYSYARPYWPLLLIGGLLSLIASAGSLITPLVVRSLIADLAGHRSIATVIVFMCVLVLVTAGVGSVGNYMLRRAAESTVLTARKRLVDRLLRLTIGALDRHEPGDLMSRVTTDTTLLRDAIASSFVGIATGALTLTATLVLMGIMDWQLLCVSLGTVAAAGVVIAVVAPKVAQATKRAQESVGMMGAALERMLGAFRTVKASGAEPGVSRGLYAAADQAWRANLRGAVWQSVILNSAVVGVQAAFLAVLALGGAQVSSGAISVGTLIAFLLYVSFLMSPVQQAVMAFTQYQIGTAAVARIRGAEIIEVEP